MYSPSSTRAGLLHNHPVQLFTGDAGFLYQGNGITRWEKQWTENAFWKQDPQLKLKQKSSLTQCFSRYRFPFQTCFVLAYCPFVHPVHPSFIYFCAGVVMYNLKIQNKTKKNTFKDEITGPPVNWRSDCFKADGRTSAGLKLMHQSPACTAQFKHIRARIGADSLCWREWFDFILSSRVLTQSRVFLRTIKKFSSVFTLHWDFSPKSALIPVLSEVNSWELMQLHAKTPLD